MYQKNINNNVEAANNGKNGDNIEYVLITQTPEMWEINFDKGIAISQSKKPDSRMYGNVIRSNEPTILEYLENNGYEIDRQRDLKSGYRVYFHKRTFIYLK
jgi:hypothetical protein